MKDSLRYQRCIVCKKELAIQSATTENPEAPEMLRLPQGMRIGIIAENGSPNPSIQMIITCSDKCLDELLDD